jgi:hypothetical protein
MKSLLGTCCGIAGTELGSIDFTGCWFLEEPCAVFRPALTLTVDDAARRWIAEVGDTDLPGPVWCLFPSPEVAVYVNDDLSKFTATLRDRTSRGEIQSWLHDLTAQARAIWRRRHLVAKRPHEVYHTARTIRDWLMGLPHDAYIYDLRSPAIARGWPFGLGGPSGRLYRCGRLPVFAVTGCQTEGWRAPVRAVRSANSNEPPIAEVSFAIDDARRYDHARERI